MDNFEIREKIKTIRITSAVLGALFFILTAMGFLPGVFLIIGAIGALIYANHLDDKVKKLERTKYFNDFPNAQ